jgi:hypothetical protein
MRTQRTVLPLLVVGLSAAALAASARWWPAVAERTCPAVAAARTQVVPAVMGNEIHATGGESAVPAAPSGSMLRHVSISDAGIAHVVDRPGEDLIVLTGRDGTTRQFAQRGEAMHPAWSRDGTLAWGLDDRLVVRAPEGSIRSMRGPRQGGIVVAPVFDGGSIVSVVAAAPTPAVPEDEWSDDLWRFRPGPSTWRRLTSFPADGDRWTAIRTPVVAPDGSIEFVVIRGWATRTTLPRFELWRLRGGQVERIGRLDAERYLAGFDTEGHRLWNVPDRETASWSIVAETPASEVTVGCGAVAVDPMDVADPDRSGSGDASGEGPASRSLPMDPVEAALLVGDFAARSAAAVVAHEVAEAFAGGYPVDVVRGAARSPIVRPDRWAVLVRLPATTDGASELARLRALLPGYAQHSWIVVP